MDTVLFTDTTAAAADAPLSVIETSAWLSSNIRYEILSPSVMVFDDSIVVYDAKEVETNRLMAVKRYKLPPGGRGALVKRIIEAEQEILVAVQGGVSTPATDKCVPMLPRMGGMVFPVDSHPEMAG